MAPLPVCEHGFGVPERSRSDAAHPRGHEAERYQRVQHEQVRGRARHVDVSIAVRRAAAVVRISWVYGPPLVPRVRDNPRGPIPLFLKLALAGAPIREPGGGEFAASFTYVADVAAGLVAAYDAKALSHDVYHLGSGRNFSTYDVAALVRAVVPEASIEVDPGTAPWTDNTRMRGPLAGTRLFDDTGFVPAFGLEAGIRAFADWMRSHPDVYRD